MKEEWICPVLVDMVDTAAPVVPAVVTAADGPAAWAPWVATDRLPLPRAAESGDGAGPMAAAVAAACCPLWVWP